jgi:hypothetical protein
VHLNRALRPLRISGGIRVQNAGIIVEDPLPLRALIRTNVDLV